MAKKRTKVRSTSKPRKVRIGPATLFNGDCRDVLENHYDNKVHALVSDPPYDLTAAKRGQTKGSVAASKDVFKRVKAGGFMGQAWDGTGVAFDPHTWAVMLALLEPGAHLLAFGGTRTYHRMTCAIEDAGFEIRDCLMWLYGSGFPKSQNTGKAVDALMLTGSSNSRYIKRANEARPGEGRKRSNTSNNGIVDKSTGQERVIKDQPATPEGLHWHGYGTALKPAVEPIVLARKELIGSVAANVLKHGTGALNIDACRVGTTKKVPSTAATKRNEVYGKGIGSASVGIAGSGCDPNVGRWPANILHDGSDEVLHLFPHTASDAPGTKWGSNNGPALGKESRKPGTHMTGFGYEGSAARFFYCAKAAKKEREYGLDDEGDGDRHNIHPTVKPIQLMRYLVRLVTPHDKRVLDPFLGSGTTGIAAVLEGKRFVGVEQSPEYFEIAKARIEQAVRDFDAGIDPFAAKVRKPRAEKKIMVPVVKSKSDRSQPTLFN